MSREELIRALEERGLTVTVLSADRMKVVRPGVGLLAEEITVTDGHPYWSWGQPIKADTTTEAADRINTVVSVPPGIFRTSA